MLTTGCNFIQSLIMPRPEKRLTLAKAPQQYWFKEDEAVLQKLYDRVVTGGQVLNPATAEELLGPPKREKLFLSGVSSQSTHVWGSQGGLGSVPEADEDDETW
jgi:hypothetical protein